MVQKGENRMHIEPRIYMFKEEFMPLVGITSYQYKYKKAELLEWLKDFFEYRIIDGRPIMIEIFNQIGEYQPMPKKPADQKALTKQKKEDYNTYVIEHLSNEPKPMSKVRMAANAIEDFSENKYGHTSSRSVARTYVGPAMERHGIRSEQKYWCWYSTYEVLTDKQVEEWRDILAKWKCTEKEVYNAFCQKQTLDDDEELVKLEGAFKAALSEFRAKYGDMVVLVPKWRIASAAEKAQKQSKE